MIQFVINPPQNRKYKYRIGCIVFSGLDCVDMPISLIYKIVEILNAQRNDCTKNIFILFDGEKLLSRMINYEKKNYE